MNNDNMNVTSRVIKNSSLLLLASVINNIMTFILTLFTARYLGAYDFGIISSAISIVGIFGIFCDLGFSTYAIREVSRNEELTGVYFGTVFLLRIISSVITCVIYVIYVLNSNFTTDGINVMLLFGIYMFFNSFVCCCYSLFQSNEKMEYQTIGNVIYSVSVLLIILLIIFRSGTVIIVASAYSIAIFLSLLYCLHVIYRKYPKLSVCMKKSFIKKILVNGIPFGITSVFTSIYFWIASIILTYMSGSLAVGLFSSSQKLLLVLSAIFYLISNAIFPVMSELFAVDKDKLVNLYHKLMKYLLILGMSMAAGTFVYSKEIIYVIYGAEYVVGYHALTILIWAGIFMFLSGISSTLLGAINKQVSVTKNAAIGALFSVTLNIILISRFSYLGASVSTVCTEFLILVLMLYALRKTEYKINLKKSVIPFIQVSAANVIMVAVLLYLQLPFIAGFPVAVIVYITALIITKSLNKEDMSIVLDFINDIKNRT